MPSPSRLLLLLALLLAPLAAGEARPQADVIASLRPYLAASAFAGAVTLVADPQGILSEQAIGQADLATERAMRTDALFWIASMSKPLTASVLMMLVDEGRVDLSAPVARYLPEFASMQVVASGKAGRKPAKHAITVRQLLAHTSGLPFLPPADGGKLDLRVLAESVAGMAKLPLDFEPGSAWSYSNCGIDTAGRIIEVVVGRPYAEVMRERLFAPLGMVDTTSVPSEAQVARLATSYKPGAAGALEATPIRYLTYPLSSPARQANPGGGFFSTARDLACFVRMLLNGGELDGRRHLSASALQQMTTSQTGALSVGYGLGFALPGSDYGHGGAYNTDLWVDTRHRLATIFLVQAEAFAGSDGEEMRTAFKQAAVVAYTRR